MTRARAAVKRSSSPPQITNAPSAIATPPPKKKARKNAKSEVEDPADLLKEAKSEEASGSASATLAKKLKQLETYQQTPFPDYSRPTSEECQGVCDALAQMHKLPQRPVKIERLDSVGAACGMVPNVLDALVRTILSQNTSNKNSTNARKGIEEKFGTTGDGPNYEAVRQGSQEDLMEAIQSGGLAKVKSKVIKTILDEVYEKYGKLSLDHLHSVGDQDAMRELVSFHGVGPKTASCVLLFCLSRESFAVDTHVFRITKALGWTPARADRETAFQHLDVKIPGPLKYPLHSMLVRHGRECKNCAAGSSPTKDQRDSCPIRPYLSKKPAKLEKEDNAAHAEEETATPSKRRKTKAKKEEPDGDMHGLEG